MPNSQIFIGAVLFYDCVSLAVIAVLNAMVSLK